MPATPAWAETNILGMAIAAFTLFMLVEMLVARYRQPEAYEYRDTATSMLMGYISLFFGALYGVAQIGVILAVYEVRLFDIGWTWWALVICFFAEDFVYYWGHRLSHEHRFWWASHVIHHSSQHFNGSTALRQSWTGIFGAGFFIRLPLFFIGFPPAMVLFFTAVTAAYQLWVHSEQIGKLGPLEWVLNTASHHRVHHSSNPRYLDRNHGGFLIIWDRLFGTFAEERDDEPCRYGIVTNIATFNLFRVALHEWAAIWRDVMTARSSRDALGYFFGPPGWSPDGSRQTSHSIRQQWAAQQSSLQPAE